MEWKSSLWITCKYTAESSRAIKVEVEFDFTGLTDEQRLEWLTNGQSPRVYVQSQLRRLTEGEFLKLDGKKYSVAFRPTGSKGVVDVESAMVRKFATMTDEEKAEFLAKLQG